MPLKRRFSCLGPGSTGTQFASRTAKRYTCKWLRPLCEIYTRDYNFKMSSRSMFGHKLDSQAKQMALNVYKYFRAKKLDPSSLEYEQDINLNKTVAEATGLSEKSVSRIVQEGRLLKDNESFKSQPKTKQVRRKKIHVDDLTREVIKRKVTEFYTLYKKVPSLKTLNAVLREENILHCGREYLRLLLQDLGFEFEKCQSKRALTEESNDEHSPYIPPDSVLVMDTAADSEQEVLRTVNQVIKIEYEENENEEGET